MSQKNWFRLTVALSLALVLAILLLPPWSPVSVTSQPSPGAAAGTIAQQTSIPQEAPTALPTPVSQLRAVGGVMLDQDVLSVEDLIQATEASNWKERWDAVNALGGLKDTRAIPALVQRALHDDNPHPRWRSLWALSSVEREGSKAIPLLLTALESPDPVVVRNAGVALAFFAQPEARPELLRGLNDPDSFRRWEAVFSLKNVGDPEVVAALIPLLNEEIESETRVRQEAALALGRIGDSEAVPALLDALQKDRSPQVRWRAAMALSQLGDATLVSELKQALSTEEAPQVREHIEAAVAKLLAR